MGTFKLNLMFKVLNLRKERGKLNTFYLFCVHGHAYGRHAIVGMWGAEGKLGSLLLQVCTLRMLYMCVYCICLLHVQIAPISQVRKLRLRGAAGSLADNKLELAS